MYKFYTVKCTKIIYFYRVGTQCECKNVFNSCKIKHIDDESILNWILYENVYVPIYEYVSILIVLPLNIIQKEYNCACSY